MSPRASDLSIVAFEPWLGGSHARFLEGWRTRSEHDVDVVGLPARHWKWRMSAGAWELAQRVRSDERRRPDAMLVSDFVDLPQLLAFLPETWRGAPTILYFHENQLTYPSRLEGPARERDLTYGFTNVLACLAADAIVFNSAFHRDSFATAADELLARLPKPGPRAALAAALEGARVIAPGVDLATLAPGPGAEPGEPLRVVFNHRWEHDKDPAAFLAAAIEVSGTDVPFELVLLGETFADAPADVADMLERLAPRVLHRGYAPDRAEYASWLGRSDLAVSTALHEFFGIAVVEAMGAGCTPLVPARLAYPEVVARELHGECLYGSVGQLVERWCDAARGPEALRDGPRRVGMRESVQAFDAARTAALLDGLAASLVERPRSRGDGIRTPEQRQNP